MVRIADTSNIDEFEKEKMKKEEDILLVGKQDKSINVVSQGKKFPLKELPVFNRTSDYRGVVTMPTGNLPFVMQYGELVVPANTATEVEFHIPFEKRCFQTQVTIGSNVPGDVIIKAKYIDETKFEVEVTGATSTNATFYWFAIGF